MRSPNWKHDLYDTATVDDGKPSSTTQIWKGQSTIPFNQNKKSPLPIACRFSVETFLIGITHYTRIT